ncbi:hypothetical protein TNCV_4087801 [Trichonephila clavipes]|nr:hypothetical protein TNCV_4087801 [Trichonephila clavipes]
MQRLPETGRLGIVPTHKSCVVVTSDDTITARIENFLKILYWETMACSSSNVGRNNINGRKLLILICTQWRHHCKLGKGNPVVHDLIFTINGCAASRCGMGKFDSIVFSKTIVCDLGVDTRLKPGFLDQKHVKVLLKPHGFFTQWCVPKSIFKKYSRGRGKVKPGGRSLQ